MRRGIFLDAQNTESVTTARFRDTPFTTQPIQTEGQAAKIRRNGSVTVFETAARNTGTRTAIPLSCLCPFA